MKIFIDGQKLAVTCLKKEISLNDICKISSLSRATISAASNGRAIQLDTASKICKALNCKIEEIAAD